MSLIIWDSRSTSFLAFIDAKNDRRSTNRAASRKRLLRFAPLFFTSLPNPRLFTAPKIKTDIPDSTLVYPKLSNFTTKKSFFSEIFTTFRPLLSNIEFQLSPSKGLIGLSKKERSRKRPKTRNLVKIGKTSKRPNSLSRASSRPPSRQEKTNGRRFFSTPAPVR